MTALEKGDSIFFSCMWSGTNEVNPNEIAMFPNVFLKSMKISDLNSIGHNAEETKPAPSAICPKRAGALCGKEEMMEDQMNLVSTVATSKTELGAWSVFSSILL